MINKYYKIISIGHRCTSQIAINAISTNQEVSPFSWVNNFNSNNVLNVIKTNFSNYITDRIKIKNYHLKEDLNKIKGHGFGHYNINDRRIIESFDRKIKRFIDILNDNIHRYLLVYINEDYIYNEDYRKDDENYNNLKKINDYLLNKYPNFKFDIFNITFEKRDNYKNIINIYYKRPFNLINRKDWLLNMRQRSRLENIFRTDCGKLLKKYISE